MTKMEKTKILVIGIDGATLDIISTMIKAGQLLNIGKLILLAEFVIKTFLVNKLNTVG